MNGLALQKGVRVDDALNVRSEYEELQQDVDEHSNTEPMDPVVVDAVHKLCSWDGQCAAVGHALAAGMDVSAGDNFAIRFAASQGHVHVVKLLCGLPRSTGVVPASLNNEALRQAACHGHFSVVEFLCGLPEVDPSAGGQLALLTAAEHGHLECVRFLCKLPRERGVDPSIRNTRPLRLAAQNGHAQVVQFLWSLPHERGVHNTLVLREALMRAAQNGRTAVVAFFCNHTRIRDLWRRGAVRLAAQKGHCDAVRVLLQWQPQHCWSLALSYAANHGQVDVAMFIADQLHLRRYTELGERLTCAVGLAARQGHAALVQALCDLPPAFGVHPARSYEKENVRVAAARGHAAVVKTLCSLPVSRGVNVACSSHPGESALQVAARNGHIDVVRCLCSLPLDRGVDPSAQNYAALRYAACLGKVDTLREVYGAACERGLLRPQVMLAVLQSAAHCSALRCVRFLCCVTPGLRSYAARLLGEARADIHTWTETDAALGIIRQELLWRRAHALLSITQLLRCGRARRRHPAE